MNKNQLIEKIAPRLGGRRAAAHALDTILDEIVREVTAGGKVSITGFGTLLPVDKAERGARNPQTGQPVLVPATRKPRFIAGQNFQDLVAGIKPLPEGSAAGKAPKGSLQGGAA